MNQIATKPSRLSGLDALKALCALLVVCIHAPLPGVIGTYVDFLSRVAVPIFLMITGFFYEATVSRGRDGQQIRRIASLLLWSNLLFCLWGMVRAALLHVSPLDWLRAVLTPRTLGYFLFLNESPFEGHLWYFGALLYALLIIRLLRRRGPALAEKLLPALLLGNLLLAEIIPLFTGQPIARFFYRNFLFTALPYLVLGMILYQGQDEVAKLPQSRRWLAVAGALCLSLAERALLNALGRTEALDHYVTTLPLAASVFVLCLGWNANGKVTARLADIGRKHAAWLFILHPILIYLWNELTARFGWNGLYLYLRPLIVYGTTLLLLVLIHRGTGYMKRRRNS